MLICSKILRLTQTTALSRREFGQAGLLAAAGLAMPVLQAQTKPEKARLVLAVGGKSALHHLPLTIAEQLGYFRAEGLELEISDVQTSLRATQAVSSGAAQVCASAFEQVLGLQAKNQWFQAFVVQARTPQIAFGVSTRSMPNYKTPADLKDKKIGIVQTEAASYMVVNWVLARARLSPNEVNLLEFSGTASALAALRSGQIDAISYVDPVMTMLEQKGDIKIVADTRTLKGATEVFGGAMPSASLFAPIEFIQKNPNTCQALANAMVHSLKWLQTAGPSDMINTVPESYLLGDRALYLASFNKIRESISPDGMMPDDGPSIALAAFGQYDAALRLARLNVSKTYTNEFSRRAKQRFLA
jgi:NitT/TauT family transport system substrate-binding protein